ncbi:DUF6082 family protein [Nonomuraea recticatena]|uniref:DUF6082 family protein n=1 Tax=Nonomuraea recticatena TaxID=46178 RepID=UPI0031F8BACA
MFTTEAGRRFWERTREHRMSVAKNKRHASFAMILDSVGKATPPPARSAPRPRAIALVGVLMWARRRRSRRVP